MRLLDVRKTPVAGLALVLIGGCSAPSQPAITTPVPTPTSTSVAPDESRCGDELPVFATYLTPQAPLAVDGAPGPGPNSIPPDEGQTVAHWDRGGGLVIEIRWPATKVPQRSITNPFGDGYYRADLWPTGVAYDVDRVLAIIQVGEDANDPCSKVSVEVYEPYSYAIHDELYSFVSLLRPVTEKAAFLAGLTAIHTRATGDGRPEGDCAGSAATDVEQFGEPQSTATAQVVEWFLADRLAGNAAELCLTVSGLRAYEEPIPDPYLPSACLIECGGVELVGGELLLAEGQQAELFVDYRLENGEVVRLREVLKVTPVATGSGGHIALISNAYTAVESNVDVKTAHGVIADFLDALAAGEYQIALAYLMNEGVSEEVVRRLAVPWDQISAQALADFCRKAACGSPYEIGETVAVTEWDRSLRVTFQMTAGPVDADISVGDFEAHLSVSNLPPDGSPLVRMDPLDVRLFGEPYSGTINFLRYEAVETVVRGQRTWQWFYVNYWPREVAVVGRHVVSGIEILAPDAGQSRQLAEGDSQLVGSGSGNGRSLVFITDESGRQLDVIDLDTGERVMLLDLGETEESLYAADFANDTLLVTLGAGESGWFETYVFDAKTLTLGRRTDVKSPAGIVGIGHLSPDGTRIATTLDPSFYDPIRTIVVMNMSGSILGDWTVNENETVEEIAFDGRWIVAALNGTTTLVIDAESGEMRRIDSVARVLFE